jgi:hypothetical protein
MKRLDHIFTLLWKIEIKSLYAGLVRGRSWWVFTPLLVAFMASMGRTDNLHKEEEILEKKGEIYEDQDSTVVPSFES